jgi:hypothetical protein
LRRTWYKRTAAEAEQLFQKLGAHDLCKG